MKLGVIGVGQMGLAMAQRLLEGGHAVAVRDVRAPREALAQAAGAEVLATPRAVAQACGLVIVAVVDAAQCEAVLWGDDGLLAAARPGLDVMLSSTIAPGDVERFAALLQARGSGCLDAPMSGGPQRAREGSMSLMLACDAALQARHGAVLGHLASRLFRVGQRPGDGARTKLVNNLLAAVNLAGAAEALALAERLGLDAQTTLDVIEQSSGQSWIGSDRLRRALAGDMAPRAHLGLLAKDSTLALQAAASSGFSPAMGAAAQQLFAAACAQGLGTQDDAALWAWLAQRASHSGT